MHTAPRRIEWAGPEGWTVLADEDGVRIHTPKGDGLEATDLTRLMDLIAEARAQVTAGQIPAPTPPTKEEARAINAHRHEAYIARRAIRAVEREFADEEVPF